MEEELRLGRRTSEATGACLVRQRLTSREHSPVRQYVFSSSLSRSTEIEAEIEDFLEGFNQPTYRGMRINGQRVATWSSDHGWSGDGRCRMPSGYNSYPHRLVPVTTMSTLRLPHDSKPDGGATRALASSARTGVPARPGRVYSGDHTLCTGP
jgi:hypothetical protein